MKKDSFGLALGAMFLALGFSAQAQQTGKIHRIGFLSGGVPGSSRGIPAIQQELRALGYVEGKNIAFEYRYAEDKPDRSPALADELVRLKVDVIVAGGDSDTRAAKNATRTIPIVFLGPCLILLRLGWLTAWRGLEGTSQGSPPSRRCWLANDWSYSRKPFPNSPALLCCGIHSLLAMRHNGKKANLQHDNWVCNFIPWK